VCKRFTLQKSGYPYLDEALTYDVQAQGVLLLMNASGENFLPKSRGYAKIGIGSQYGLAKISFDFTLQGGAACQSRMSMITLLSSITSRAAGAIL
jgi:hypothetical protein